MFQGYVGKFLDQRKQATNKNTLPETNVAPEDRPSQKETIVFQASISRGYVRFREGKYILVVPSYFWKTFFQEPTIIQWLYPTISWYSLAPTYLKKYSYLSNWIIPPGARKTNTSPNVSSYHEHEINRRSLNTT